MLTAFVVGVEVEAKLGRALNPAHYEVGWHATFAIAIVPGGARVRAPPTATCPAQPRPSPTTASAFPPMWITAPTPSRSSAVMCLISLLTVRAVNGEPL